MFSVRRKSSNLKRQEHDACSTRSQSLFVVLLLALAFQPTYGWVTPWNPSHSRPILSAGTDTRSPVRSSNSISTVGLHMTLSNLFGGPSKEKDPKQVPTLPRDVKEAVSKCRAAVQDALQQRTSRMDIEFPVGTKFGVEKGSKKNSKKNKLQQQAAEAAGGGKENMPTLDDLQTSDRELARLFVDMFQPVGGDQISVVFVDSAQADAAKQNWKLDSTAKCRILALNRRKTFGGAAQKKKNKSATKAKGFASKLAAEIDEIANSDSSSSTSSGPFQLPDKTEVAIFVAPGPKELIFVERICNDVGMGTLVILLNARLGSIERFGTVQATKLFTQEFETVFHLAAVQPQDAVPNCLLYRSYPGQYVLARKPKVGTPKTILVSDTRPTLDECRTAYENMDVSDFEQGFEKTVENVANWFR